MTSNGISRRTFMRRTAGVAGAAVAGRLIMLDPGRAPAATLKAAGRGLAAPSDTVHFGMIGIGMQGSGLLGTAIQLPGVECIAACDLYDGRLELAKEIVGKPIATTRRYQDLLANKDVDCLIAAVPDHWHKQIVVDACNAGKDIYCEKPMTHHVEEGFEIIAAEQKNSRIVQIGSQRRSSILFNKARDLVAHGEIGDVCLVEAGLGRNDPCGAWVYPPPPDLSPQNLDWETWQGTAPKHAFDPIRFARWRAFQDYGEGVPGDLCVHLLTGIHSVMAVGAPPDRAVSFGGLFRWTEDGRDQPDCMTTLYEYPKFRSSIRVTLNTDMPEITRFMGTRGIIELRDDAVFVTHQDGQEHGPCYYTSGYPQALRAEYVKHWEETHETKPGTAQALESVTYRAPDGYNEDREHLWNYFQSVRTRAPSVEDGTFGNNAAIACHMANASYFRKGLAEWNAAGRKIENA
ncbi:MAG TPA: Gfo/Idh/MocA family oxidoreductase [Terriglobia bacterium]|jgi:predicted dehydrogenase|nr:Gfo/Idh/MocA family oxidoreductase [Terriglobia bacterium]